jgi:hypothetical protein
MIKTSIFANRKGPAVNGLTTSTSNASVSSSLVDHSLQQNYPLASNRPWQGGTPTNAHRLIPFLQPTYSSTNLRAAIASTNVSNFNPINRTKPVTLQGLVEQLNEVSFVLLLRTRSSTRADLSAIDRIDESFQSSLRHQIWFRGYFNGVGRQCCVRYHSRLNVVPLVLASQPSSTVRKPTVSTVSTSSSAE